MLDSTSNTPYKLVTAPAQLRKSATLPWAFHTGLNLERSKGQLAGPGPNWRHLPTIQHDFLPSADLMAWSLLRSPLTQVDIPRTPGLQIRQRRPALLPLPYREQARSTSATVRGRRLVKSLHLIPPGPPQVGLSLKWFLVDTFV